MTKKLFALLSLIFLTYLSIGQTTPKYIFFYKPYTDSLETNLYKDTIIKFDYNIQYMNLKSADVAADVELAMGKNDFRIVSISGQSYLYPGLEGGYEKYKDGTKAFIYLAKKYEDHYNKYGFKVIYGTSDFMDSDSPPLQTVAYNYAHTYNKLLFKKMKGLSKEPKN